MNGIWAFLISLVAPGAGQIFNGQYVLGVLLGGMFALGKTALLPLLIRLLKIRTEVAALKLVYWFNWAYGLCVLFAIFQAAVVGFEQTQRHPWTALISAFAIVCVYKNTMKEILFAALCGRTGMYQLIRPVRKSAAKSQAPDGNGK